jgi:hypothetical protein
MSLGFDRDANVVNLSDSAEVYATLADVNDTPLGEDDLLSVSFTIQKPDRTKESLSGQILDTGQGFLRYEDTDQVGVYMAVAQFTLLSGEVRSVRCDFEVIDPFNPPEPEFADVLHHNVWKKIEDCFDSEQGGPWLRDMTLEYFSKDKVPDFIDEGLMDINLYQPVTDLTVDYFDAPRHDGSYPFLPLLVESCFLAIVRHLMRSYVEQPQPTGAQIVYEDRQQYLQRWQLVYQQEYTLFDHWAKLFKRQFYQFGHSKLIVANKAGRTMQAPMRQWSVQRGYW